MIPVLRCSPRSRRPWAWTTWPAWPHGGCSISGGPRRSISRSPSFFTPFLPPPMTHQDPLQNHRKLCDELYQFALEENRFLKEQCRPPAPELIERKRALLV